MIAITVTFRKDSFSETLIKQIANGYKGTFIGESLTGGEITLSFELPTESQCDRFKEECLSNPQLRNINLIFGGIYNID